MAAASALQDDPDRESLVKADPVQSLFNVRQAGNRCAVLLKESPSDTLHFSLEAYARITQQRDVSAHSRAYSVEQILPEIGEHIPITIVHERENWLADVGVLALGNVEICDVTVERSPDKTVVVVELSVLDIFLCRSHSLVHVAEDSQCVLCFLMLGSRGRNSRLRRLIFVARFDNIVISNEIMLAQRDDTVQILFGIRCVYLTFGQLSLGGVDCVAQGLDFNFSQVQFCPGSIQSELVGTRIHNE